MTVIDLNLLHRAVGRARDVEDAIDMFEGGVLDGKALNRGLSAIQEAHCQALRWLHPACYTPSKSSS